MRAQIRPYPLPEIQVADVPTTPAPTVTTAPAVRQARPPVAPRLLSLDVFRGLVICAMLIVNNLGDSGTTGYFWKHADWPAMRPREAWIAWRSYAVGSDQAKDRAASLPLERVRLENEIAAKKTEVRLAREKPADPWQPTRLEFEKDQLEVQFHAIEEEQRMAEHPWRNIPLFWQCTLADYVMPWFMLIIGVAIPFSVAASKARGAGFVGTWLRVLRRTFMLILLGWILVYFRDQFAASWYGQQPWNLKLGMDVLQLLGVAYLVARFFHFLPPGGRALVATCLLAWHWYLLRFWPQGPTSPVIIPAGTFMHSHEAIGDIYANSEIWHRFTQWHWGDRLMIVGDGLLSVPPAAAMMLIGTLMGETLQGGRRRGGVIEPRFRAASLASWGLFLALAGFLWSFEIPFNKPRWSPSYIVYVAGIGGLLLATLYAILDLNLVRAWAYPFAVFGANAIAVYFLSILAKVLLLNVPRVGDDNFLAHACFKWGTFAMMLLVLGVLLMRFSRYCAAQIGNAAYAMLLIAAIPAWIAWDRFNLTLLEPTTRAATQHPIEIILSTLKLHLGNWGGGWMFTIIFVSFWWLMLDAMYRRRIFWKL